MTKQKYPLRLATLNSENWREYLELHENGVFFLCDDTPKLGSSVPVPLWYAEEFFVKCGRTLDATKLPISVCKDPYL